MKNSNSLSVRLLSVASMVTEGTIAADVGTDHGYVPIYLVKNNICKSAYALDVNEGPLAKAKENIRKENLQDSIEAILSDGLLGLENHKVDSVIIAGMGGLLITKILNEAPNKDAISEFVISPHRDIDTVRKTIIGFDFLIADEKIVKDAGKYYFIIKAVNTKLYESGQLKGNHIKDYEMYIGETYSDFDYYFGKRLFEKKDKLFLEYLNYNVAKYSEIVSKIGDCSTDNKDTKNILSMYKMAVEKYKNF